MIFLTQLDLDTAIKADNLTQITGNQPALLDAVELQAIQNITGYLKAKYDVASIFSASGAGRNALLVKYTTDIALYYIHSRVSPRQVPEYRLALYEQAIEWLKMVMKGSIIPDLPAIPSSEENNGGIVHGSNQPFRY